jgi:hypothetical protein
MKNKKEDKVKKYDMNRIEQIEYAWKQNKTKSNSESSPEEIVEDSIEMSLQSIKIIAKLITELATNINEENAKCLAEPWVAAKLTLASDYVAVINDYIMYYVEFPEEPDDTEEESEDAFFGGFDGHDGHSSQAVRFGGKKRSELKDSDFLFPEDRSFPIVVPKDIKDAVRNFGRSKKNISYDTFIKKLYNKAKNKGPEFVAAIPKATKDKLGIKKDKADYERGNF